MPQLPVSVQRRSLSLIALASALVGSILLVETIRRVGWDNVIVTVTSVGWGFGPVLVLGLARAAVRAQAWMVCIKQSPDAAASTDFRFRDALNAILVADAVGNLTPLGLLASEPTRILMSRSRLWAVTSIATVAIENAAYTASVIVVLLSGTWLLSQRATLPQAIEIAAEVLIVAVLIIGVVTLWLARARPAILSRLAPLVGRIGKGADAPDEALRDVETRIYNSVHMPIGHLVHLASWEALFHVLAVLEVWLVLRMLPGSGHASLEDAFLLESAGRFVIVAFKFIPFRLGVDEVGAGLVAGIIGIPPVAGVTLALVRRLRIVVLNAAGLLILARRR